MSDYVYSCPGNKGEHPCDRRGDNIKCQICWDEQIDKIERERKRIYDIKHHKGKRRSL